MFSFTFFFMYTRDVWNLWPPTMMTKRTKNLAAKNYVQNDYIKFSKLLHKVATSICGVWENIEVKNTSVCLHHSLFMNTNIHFFRKNNNTSTHKWFSLREWENGEKSQYTGALFRVQATQTNFQQACSYHRWAAAAAVCGNCD